MDSQGTSGSIDQVDYGQIATNLIVAYVAHNRVPAAELPGLIAAAGAAFTGLQSSGRPAALGTGKATPAQIQASIQYEALISFEDGKPHKILKRHLTACGLTPETYRAKWGLPSNYPMVAPAYAVKRSRIAKGVMARLHQHNPAPTAAVI